MPAHPASGVSTAPPVPPQAKGYRTGPSLSARGLVLLVSAGIHLAAGFALVGLSPDRERPLPFDAVNVVPPPTYEVVAEPSPEPPTAVAEEVTEPIALPEGLPSVDTGPDPVDPATVAEAAGLGMAASPAFGSLQWNLALGDGGGAGGIGGTGGRYEGRAAGSARKTTTKPYAEAIDAGLQWLQRHQDADGRWDCDRFMKHDDPSGPICDGGGNAMHDVGVTGLAMLAFLGDGHSARNGTYKDSIRRGAKWLREQQQTNGLFGSAAANDFIYDHAIAAYAMCEAYGLSDSPLLRDCAQKGLDYLELHRNPGACWRYRPQGGANDTSVTGWCLMACESGRYFGLQVPEATFTDCAKWLDTVADPTGMHGYGSRGEMSSRKPGVHQARFPPDKTAAMTAVGLLCRYFLHQDERHSPVMRGAAELLRQHPPQWDTRAGTIDHYYWYHATYALFQKGGTHWNEWQKKLDAAVVKTQHRDRSRKNLYGSWDPDCAWGEDGGRIYSTAILTLTLQAHYRYTRLVR